jgi:hypothetical protein
MLLLIFSFCFGLTFILNGNNGTKSRYLSDIQRAYALFSDVFPLNRQFIHWINLRILNTLSVSSNSSYAMDSFIQRFQQPSLGLYDILFACFYQRYQ